MGDTRRVVFRHVSDGGAEAPQIFSGDGVSYPVVAAGEGYWIVLWSAEGRRRSVGHRGPANALDGEALIAAWSAASCCNVILSAVTPRGPGMRRAA